MGQLANSLGKPECGAGADSGESFGSRERAFAPPFVILAQLGLMFLDLRFEITEGLLATGPHGGAGSCRMQRSGGERQIQRTGMLVRARSF